MHLKYLLAASVAGASLACAIVTPVVAQDITSAIDGQVTDQAGAPVAGATVTVTHVPSGTVSTTMSDSGGHYGLRGLRVGGPYTVSVRSAGEPATTIDNVQLAVGETFALPLQFGPQEIIVTGTRERRGRELVTGSQSVFDSQQIANTVSARRDIRDVIRKDLLSTYNANVGGVSIAGGNIRTQRFSVGGVQVQDSFGLNYGGLPSARGIVSLEAIDQLTVKAAPFDISEGNFQGGAVNVVLKSGTNQPHGSAFGNFGGDAFNGNFTRNNRSPTGTIYPVARTPILDFRNYGASLGGAIIKDKLFLFLAYEHLTEGTPNTFGLADSGAANLVPNAVRGDTPTRGITGLDNVLSAFKANYGSFDVGDVPTAISEVDKKYSAKLDWNISSRQRFTASFIHHENTLPQYGSAGSTSTQTPYIAVLSDLYRLTEFTNAGSAQLNSQWTDRFTTEVRAAYKFYRRGQDAFNGTDFAQFNICSDNVSSAPLGTGTSVPFPVYQCGTGNPIYRLGPDTARQANKFNNKQLTFQTNATYQAGTHQFRLEYDNVYSKNYNLFVFGTSGLSGTGGPQGLYYFDSYQDFVNRRANELILNSTTTGNKNDGFVRWAYTTHTVGLQDTWKVDPTLTINYGLRYDFIRADKTIGANQNFVNRFGLLYPGLVNTATLNGRDKLQPRVGINWKPTPTLRIAGGGGLFEGGLSDVFISNNYSNSGAPLNASGAIITGIDLVRNSTGCFDRTNPTTPISPAICGALSNINGATPNAAALAYLQTATGPLANVTTNSLDPRFKLPAQWKYNVSVNWQPEFSQSAFGRGWSFRADALFSDAQSAIRWIDLRARPLVINGVNQVTADGRQRYGGAVVGLPSATNPTGIYTPGGNSDIQLTNTGKGIARVFAVGVNKTFDFVDISAGYTHQTVKDVAGVLVSSTVGSSYGVPTTDANGGGAYGRSVFEVKNSYHLEAQLHHKFFGDAETRFGIAWYFRSGVPYSLVMNDNTSAANGRATVFGTVNTNSTLLYVPDFSQNTNTVAYYANGATTQTAGGMQVGNVIFSDAATLNSLKNLVTNTSLRKYQGRVVPKNSLTGPSFSKIDLNFSQQIPFFFHSKITAVFSIENFLNLLNRNWGSYQEFGNTSVVQISCASLSPTAGTQTCPLYRYTNYSDPKTTTYSKASLWALRLGARLDF